MTTPLTAVAIQRADDRFATNLGWLDSHHSFSFGNHYRADNVGHGLLIVNNDDIVGAGTGFDTHPHRDMEIVTWVLSGELEHKDSEGNHGMLYPGLAQRMTVGTGIRHSEKNPSHEHDVHFIQMWVLPDTNNLKPGYEQLDINAQLSSGELVPIASGKHHDAAIAIHQRDAVLWERAGAGAQVTLPDDRYVHLYVAKGSAMFDGNEQLATGDAVRLFEGGSKLLTATDAETEILIWATA